MDNITRLIEALRDVESEFVAAGQGRAYQGIVLTAAQAFKGREADFQALLPKAQISRTIKNPVSIKALGHSGVQGGQNSSCPTCGKGHTVPVAQNTYVNSNVLRLTKKADQFVEALENFAEVASAVGITLEEAANALETTSGTGISPEYFENPEKILTGEPVIESNEWVAVLQEVKDVKQAKELYKAITGKGYPPRWPQDLDQIAKAIWEARNNIEV